EHHSGVSAGMTLRSAPAPRRRPLWPPPSWRGCLAAAGWKIHTRRARCGSALGGCSNILVRVECATWPSGSHVEHNPRVVAPGAAREAHAVRLGQPDRWPPRTGGATGRMGAEGQGVPDGLLDKLTAELEETHAALATQS